jgi:hypothetical protein
MASPQAATSNEIIALERSYWEAMKKKDGRRTAELSGETSLVTGSRGVMSIARSEMGKMTEEGDWTLDDYAFEDVIIAYKVRQKVTMKGEAKSFEAADSSTWVRGPGGWECHAHSETILGNA